MALKERKRYSGHRTQRRAERRRRLLGMFLIAGLVVLVLGVFAYGASALFGGGQQEDVGVVEQVDDPTTSGAPEEVPEVASDNSDEDNNGDEATGDEAIGDEAIGDEEPDTLPELPAPADEGQGETAEPDELPVPQAIPSSSRMSLTIPKLGLSGVTVLDDLSEDGGLMAGAGHMPGTGFPWIPGSNTYIAGHRLGYPGTPSDHIFFNLPSLGPGDNIILTDSLGQGYTYRVSGVMEVPPTDLSVTAPTGSDSISLQVCIEDYGDYVTLGPDWNVRLIVRGERVV